MIKFFQKTRYNLMEQNNTFLSFQQSKATRNLIMGFLTIVRYDNTFVL